VLKLHSPEIWSVALFAAPTEINKRVPANKPHSIDTSKAHSRSFVAKLTSGCHVALGKSLGVGSLRIPFNESLLAEAVDANKDGTNKPGHRDRGLNDVKRVARNWPTVGPRKRHSDRP
jgi:hypothetical protein